MSWFFRSRAACTRGKGRHSPASNESRLQSRIWRSRSSKTLQLRFPDSDRGCEGAGDRAGLLTHLRDLFLELGRGFSFVGNRGRADLLHRPALLPRPLAPLFRLLIKDGCHPARTCRQAGLLPCGCERHDTNAGRRTEHRSSSVRESEQFHRGIRS
jgi:hypothetical protein